MNKLSHVDAQGRARMVDVGEKAVTAREAVATGTVRMSPEVLRLLVTRQMPKGDVLAVARVAGIMAAKKTPELIPLCHPLPISAVSVEFTPQEDAGLLTIETRVKVEGKTGVEMEALTAVSVAALTIYDMCKAVDKGMIISDICLLKKTGGKSGTYERPK
ncbi:MAG TPA: cyclic pyranopterin monophosphate synthase MoaC [Candidatus Binatia bacterium]|nr:cyclic pyranopterin monophosphate synthase MoaC [Candidatus Binatia bacterium]